MNTNKILFEKFKLLSGSALKLIAIITMTIDHTAILLAREFDFMTHTLFSLFGREMSAYFILRKIGRLAFPLFCFLIIEGFLHTKNRKQYGINLACFAVISEIPYDLFFKNKLFYFSSQNIFFTLFLGFLVLVIFESQKPDHIKFIFAFAAAFSAHLLHSSYGIAGVLFIAFLYILRNNKYLQTLLALPFLSGGFAAWSAFIPINMYNGKRGFIQSKILKYAFYIFYPLHLIILDLLSKII